MSFAALFCALAALMQLCMLSAFGRKQLHILWLSKGRALLLRSSAIILLFLSLILNCAYEGNSVGPITWLFVILTTAFFLQCLMFYQLRAFYMQLSVVVIVLAVMTTLLQCLA